MDLKKLFDNKKVVVTVAVICVFLLLGLVVLLRKPAKEQPIEKEDIHVTMRQELLDTEAPDIPDSLPEFHLDAAYFEKLTAAEKDLPNPAVEWFVEGAFDASKSLRTENVTKLFDALWLADAGNPWIYVKSTSDNEWTPIQAQDAVDLCRGIRFGLRYFEPQDQGDIIRTEQDFNLLLGKTYVTSVELADTLGQVTIRPCCSPKEGNDRAALIRDLYYTSNREMHLQLKAARDTFFPARTVWNTLRALGFSWIEDDGRFHLYATEDAEQKIPLFTIWPECEQLHFPLEAVYDNSLRTSVLHFAFSIPRTPQPALVCNLMIQAADILKKHCGGELLTSDGKPVDINLEQETVKKYDEYLSNAGYPPGSDQNLQIFPPLEINPIGAEENSSTQ